MASGVAVLCECRFERDAVVLSTLMMSSFAGLAVVLIPWLLSGGTLALHHPFDPEIFLAQRRSIRCDTVIVPGPLVAELAEAGQLSAADGLKRVFGVWRAPERLPRAPTW